VSESSKNPGQQLQLQRTARRLDANDVNLSGSVFENVNLSEAAFHDINFSGATIEAANMTGMRLTHVNLRDAAIIANHIDGMTINGMPVVEMIAAYKAASVKS
jgi:uncharacterized protein YjbI with pentapeptide repeats